MNPVLIQIFKASLEAQGFTVSPTSSKESGPEVLAVAARGIQSPESLTPEEVQSVCASVLAQAPAVGDFPEPG